MNSVLRREIDQFMTSIYPSGVHLEGRGPRIEYGLDSGMSGEWGKCPRAPGHIIPDGIKSIQMDDAGRRYEAHYDEPGSPKLRLSDELRSDIGKKQAFPGLDGWFDKDSAYEKSTAFARVMNDAAKAQEFLNQIDVTTAGPDEQALRRDICHAVMSQWQALTYQPDRPVTSIAFENLQMDLPDRQADLMRYVEAGAKAYNLCWERERENILGLQHSSSDAELAEACEYFGETGANMTYNFVDDCDRNFDGELSHDMIEAVRGMNKMLMTEVGMRGVNGDTTLKFGDFGLPYVSKYGVDMSDKSLNPELVGVSEYQQFIVSGACREYGMDGPGRESASADMSVGASASIDEHVRRAHARGASASADKLARGVSAGDDKYAGAGRAGIDFDDGSGEPSGKRSGSRDMSDIDAECKSLSTSADGMNCEDGMTV